jgi:NAD-dependent deacetylase
LRPHIVWFGESVPMIVPAARLVSLADILVVIGTSLAVHPAAGLIHHAPSRARRFLIDPRVPAAIRDFPPLEIIRQGASAGVATLTRVLLGGEPPR